MVVWKYKMPVIRTASWREVLIPTQPVSNVAWEKNKTEQNHNTQQIRKKSLNLNLSKSLNFALCWKLWEQVENRTTLPSVFSKQHFPFNLIAANWSKIYSCLCTNIGASVSTALGMIFACWLIVLQSQEGKCSNSIREQKLPSSTEQLRSFLCQAMIN